ncbi:hypothetical protein Rfer_3065 [Rhodoferax ferrireducens T118]|uniref:Uncharacterized protein n=1 Tax=Albidiferax ferrireducens (strain ATCC BAA-621 / DSM 15236 / T118) TaxID=338969 RepID=Q21TX8_ALBFT|nr:hypothetical protein [Rhodoferax ferrireducens]ABD70775.1 hypothetical protein Rfer_3065 [Rhodoferax ferrireducens T118]
MSLSAVNSSRLYAAITFLKTFPLNNFDGPQQRSAAIARAQILSARLGIGDVTATLANQPLHEMLATFEAVFGGLARSTLRV